MIRALERRNTRIDSDSSEPFLRNALDYAARRCSTLFREWLGDFEDVSRDREAKKKPAPANAEKARATHARCRSSQSSELRS